MVELKQKMLDNIKQSAAHFMLTQISRIFKVVLGFKMAHFEANFHAMMVGTTNCPTVNINFLTRTVQTEANGKFRKLKVKKKHLFRQFFFLRNRPLVLDP